MTAHLLQQVRPAATAAVNQVIFRAIVPWAAPVVGNRTAEEEVVVAVAVSATSAVALAISPGTAPVRAEATEVEAMAEVVMAEGLAKGRNASRAEGTVT